MSNTSFSQNAATFYDFIYLLSLFSNFVVCQLQYETDGEGEKAREGVKKQGMWVRGTRKSWERRD